jgi:hypothetical protein
MQLAEISVSGDRASIVVRGFSQADLRRRAERDCCKLFGAQECWKITGEQIAPCLRSPGGRARLYEGRFEAVCTAPASR